MIRYTTLPIPAFEQYTRRFELGPVSVGVEYRVLDEAAIAAEYGDDARAKFDHVVPPGVGEIVEEDGVCLHVFGHEDGLEYLRFDCFDDYPHYHYICAREGHQFVMEYDPVADGPILDWSLARLREQLAEMLVRAGAPDLAEKLDPSRVAAAMVEVEHEARAAAARGRPERVR